MGEIIAVAVGGGLGAVLRLTVCRYAERLLGAGFPYGTLLVNVLGGFLIGLLAAGVLAKSDTNPIIRSAIIIGCLGGFTTFSAFSLDTLTLASDGAALRAVLNAALNVVLAVSATWGGVITAKAIWS
ncbi:MAG TPA: CrcB family protein [Armatimonadota bacterium]|nr:CrcB family protein [Armatimonadota bacterium]